MSGEQVKQTTESIAASPTHESAEHAHGQVGDLVGGIIALLLIASAALAFCKKTKLPFTIVLVVIGAGLAVLVKQPWFEFLGPATIFSQLAETEDGKEVIAEIILFVFLPALVFESAFALDVRQLRHNIVPILTLAVPGLLISTLIIAGIVALLTPIPFHYALVLGAILSATDPVAVISLFKKLGAPKRLTVLVEGESLFNDATAIVASRILVGVALAGAMTPAGVVSGAGSFLWIFFGGVLVGLVLAWLVGLVLGRVPDDPFIEISLTTGLAYGSFIIAEHLLHVSGVMATVAAAVTMGAWGRAKISPSVAHYLHQFWEYLAFMANSLIFLLVGLVVSLPQLRDSASILLCVTLAMLVSRAVVVFGFVPIVGRLSVPVSRGYQAVMYWGGLRGAIALAIVLQLPIMASHFDASPENLRDFGEWAERFIPLVMGAVLFTLLVPGLTIERLVRKLGLDKPPLSDRLARIAGLLSGKQRAVNRIPDLQEGGMFSARIAGVKREQCQADIKRLQDELELLRSQGMDEHQERRLLFLRGFAAEKSLYYDMYSKGHLSESAYRELNHEVGRLVETVGYERRVPEAASDVEQSSTLSRIAQRTADRFLFFTPLPEWLRAARTARDYELCWGRKQGTASVLAELDEADRTQVSRHDVVGDVADYFAAVHDMTERRIDEMASQFPEFVGAMQERLADRLIVNATSEAIEEAEKSGMIPHGVAEHMQEEFATQIRDLRSVPVGELHVNPLELLVRVPFFQDTPAEEFERVAKLLKEQTIPAGENIILQGQMGDSLYLIARGVVRISRDDGGVSRDLATLLAGDFFGEIALLHREPRTATCRAVTPCSLFQLRRADFDEIVHLCPAIKDALNKVEQERRGNDQERDS